MAELLDIFKQVGSILQSYWWIIAPIVLFFLFADLWLLYVREKFMNSIDWILLEVKIPKEVERTPKAMEQIYAGLHGILSSPNTLEKYRDGKIQEWFSFEIIGEGGEIHFLIRTPSKFRNLVEAHVYAQYPNAEISEVSDYVKNVPDDVPNSDHDLWGTELVLTKEDPYPIRTYNDFEFDTKEEQMMVDPLAAINEILSKLYEGEKIWIQILARPVKDDWKEQGEKIVAKLMGKEVKEKKSGGFLNVISSIMGIVIDFFVSSGSKSDEGDKKPLPLMQYLSPGETDVIKAIEKNISKIGFQTNIRLIYTAPREIFSRANIPAIIGSFKQFNTINLNGFKPNGDVSPSIDYFFVKTREYKRKRKVFNAYRKRKFDSAASTLFKSMFNPPKPFVLNIEELATIYHFPGMSVEAPLLSRIEAKKGEPPIILPTE